MFNYKRARPRSPLSSNSNRRRHTSSSKPKYQQRIPTNNANLQQASSNNNLNHQQQSLLNNTTQQSPLLSSNSSGHESTLVPIVTHKDYFKGGPRPTLVRKSLYFAYTSRAITPGGGLKRKTIECINISKRRRLYQKLAESYIRGANSPSPIGTRDFYDRVYQRVPVISRIFNNTYGYLIDTNGNVYTSNMEVVPRIGTGLATVYIREHNVRVPIDEMMVDTFLYNHFEVDRADNYYKLHINGDPADSTLNNLQLRQLFPIKTRRDQTAPTITDHERQPANHSIPGHYRIDKFGITYNHKCPVTPQITDNDRNIDNNRLTNLCLMGHVKFIHQELKFLQELYGHNGEEFRRIENVILKNKRPNYGDKYLVSDKGKVYSLLSLRLLSSFVLKDGCLGVTLTRTNEFQELIKDYILVDILVASTFIGPIPLDHHVRYITPNYLNPSLDNLDYFPNSEVAYMPRDTDRLQTIQESFASRGRANEANQWVNLGFLNNHDFTHYRLSNQGQIIDSRIQNEYHVYTKYRNGYITCNLYDSTNTLHEFYIHRLVAIYFCHGRSYSCNTVQHLDGNPSNNNSSNLLWLGISESSTAPLGMPLIIIDVNQTDLFQRYNSIGRAQADFPCNNLYFWLFRVTKEVIIRNAFWKDQWRTVRVNLIVEDL
ncbi:hypothetical protein BJ944DRAFT_239401 [Cunninghamella echinulata]|nr:hypothetical protein BJ944DRAFT_239401 [Cunninghamella echinulata]